MANLIVILCDQLSDSISSLEDYQHKTDILLLCEVKDQVTDVKHHKKKIAFWFSAMRHFANHLIQQGFNVRYVHLDSPENTGSLTGEVERLLKEKIFEQIIVTYPSDYRTLIQIQQWKEQVGVIVQIKDDNRFLCSPKEFAAWVGARKQLRMEYFYREMRIKYNILMQDNKPIGGQWNYDSQNRKKPNKNLSIPKPYTGIIDGVTQEAITSVAKNFDNHFGDLEPFYFATTRAEALQALNLFIENRLVNFGDYQDAMIQDEPWMFHSHLSFYLNCGLLEPLECVREAERFYHEGKAPLNAVEGFIRQIIGWREYVRGIYWLKMPEYASVNFFNANRSLPEFYWNADTHMNCLRQCVTETKKHAYAHHIQRLMVLGNFALLTGVHPKFVNEWFLIVYADAYEWVELPNVSGMILFADGGYLASKPYAAGGSYINKMSNYCKNCHYSVTQKTGNNACPFNYLYWNFLDRNREKLKNNPRLALIYKTLEQMDVEKLKAIRADTKTFLSDLDNGVIV